MSFVLLEINIRFYIPLDFCLFLKEDPHSGKRSVNIAEPTSHCSVEQVPGLDYTEPAFQLEVVAADDKSLVTFFYQVGTVPGGSDVLPKTEYGGPSAIISQVMMP